MRTTVTLDDALIAKARGYLDTTETAVILREALKALIEREAARRLAALGGTDPGAHVPDRRRAT